MERLQKVIAHAGIASRRKAEQLITDGKVSVNGKIIRELGTKVDPNKDDIRVNGEQIFIDDEKIVILFNKPERVITSMDDPHGRRKVIDFIDITERVYPVGRLDYDTEGLLLLTNDGELAHRLMHPKYEIDKTYEVTVEGIPNEKALSELRHGIKLEDGITSPAQVKLIKKLGRQAKIIITIHEGKKRQIRRMFEAINHPVVKLKRIKYGFLTLDGVQRGKYRILSNTEVCKLKEIVKLKC
ncbi:pseudouridine synthase [Vulcanibacillus modesticaldus]|uniref:Pseudouridine synthase n=1 Tax=Vulcanibacillus modesticaldus TaxID=337097 RepID=A0A1D2YSH0_9BACI|nr:pseudouridine synthase [Vulcanibacillus modesticaldus]OEF97253.1 pseudouridine synthase [Vulcanibacillus modesticaldus]